MHLLRRRQNVWAMVTAEFAALIKNSGNFSPQPQ